jgi:hypothetical protein
VQGMRVLSQSVQRGRARQSATPPRRLNLDSISIAVDHGETVERSASATLSHVVGTALGTAHRVHVLPELPLAR